MDTFLDSFFSMILLFKLPFMPGTGELVFFAKLYFIPENYDALIFSALAGSVLGEIVNYITGISLLIAGQKSSKFILSPEKIDKYSILFNKYCIFLLPFSWITFGGFLTVGAGFFRTNIILTILLVGVGKYGYYIMVLMDTLPEFQ